MSLAIEVLQRLPQVVLLWFVWLVIKEEIPCLFKTHLMFETAFSWYLAGAAILGALLYTGLTPDREMLFWPFGIAGAWWLKEFIGCFVIGLPCDSNGDYAFTGWDGKRRKHTMSAVVDAFGDNVEAMIIVLLIRQTWVYGFGSGWPILVKIPFWIFATWLPDWAHEHFRLWVYGRRFFNWL